MGLSGSENEQAPNFGPGSTGSSLAHSFALFEADKSLSVSMLERIVEVCTEFEDLWHAGEAPQIEDYLGKARDLERSERLSALLAVELELRFRSGESVDLAEYLARFPEDLAGVREVFDQVKVDAGQTLAESASDQSRGSLEAQSAKSSPLSQTGTRGDAPAPLHVPAHPRKEEGWGAEDDEDGESSSLEDNDEPLPEAGTVQDPGRGTGHEAPTMSHGDTADLTFVLAQAEVIDAVAEHKQFDGEKGRGPGSALAEPMDSGAVKRPDRIPETYGPPSQKTGRFTLIRLIDSGMFGDVYLANDDVLHRKVALKFPRIGASVSSARVEAFLIEARNAAQLLHPGIVTVFDIVERKGGGGIFVVMQFINGPNLRDLLRIERFSAERAAALIADVADAAHFAHSHGFIHRDLKPANILIDENNRPRVADFGLAVHERALGNHAGETAGTIPYMAPEQVRGASHRLDGRTDIWALGVILYEILTGSRPFPPDRVKAFKKILYRNPRPPRDVDPSVPAELERICLKCLSKRMGERYATAAELADDLRRWLSGRAPSGYFPTAGQGSGSGSGEYSVSQTAIWSRIAHAGPDQARVIPKGLRSFTPEDAPFFLDLMPGPRDRNAIPECARFWKTRIDSTDRESAFNVGLVYGPSGCGKSSMVQAGVIPRLAPHVSTVSIATTRDGVEAELLRRIRQRCPGLPASLGLPESIRALREGTGLPPGKKLLLVLDQFEQWIQANGDSLDSPLVEGLRQCDGARVQALILIRDDFWTALNRLCFHLEVELSSERNMAAVDLFDRKHARAVLAAFGRGYGALPEDPEAIDEDQKRFLDLAIEELSEGGRVVSVQLALLAEMVKDRPWAPATLNEIGGVRGVGIAFLENAIGARAQHPILRPHREAARAILQALLPPSGLEINGRVRSTTELVEAAGYVDRMREFESVLRVLDGELRLITCTELETEALDKSGAVAKSPPSSNSTAREVHYQLTHDYLVPSLREWLERRKRETKRGRAQIRLDILATLWGDRPQPRFLPSFLEWLSIQRHTHPSEWTPAEHAMMSAANTRISCKLVGLLAVGAAFALFEWLHHH